LGEGISNTILEAMASGLPIIATRVGGNPELVTDGGNGLLVPVDDEYALANAIESLVCDKDSRERMGASSLKKVTESFSWQATVEKYLSIYDRLLGCNK
ncbi:MAG: glycosyltransferase, partial [Pseudomonadota bacterium]|nr:glycosyltransferase [Pseudomonadota bacterium]